MATVLGKAEASLRKHHVKAMKKHGINFEKQVAQYGEKVAIYNTGWLEGSDNGYQNGLKEARKIAKELRAKVGR